MKSLRIIGFDKKPTLPMRIVMIFGVTVISILFAFSFLSCLCFIFSLPAILTNGLGLFMMILPLISLKKLIIFSLILGTALSALLIRVALLNNIWPQSPISSHTKLAFASKENIKQAIIEFAPSLVIGHTNPLSEIIIEYADESGVKLKPVYP